MDEQIKEVMGAVFRLQSSEIGDAATFESIENWDSLSHLKLIVSLEEEFSIRFTDEEMVSLISLQQIRDAIAAKQAKA